VASHEATFWPVSEQGSELQMQPVGSMQQVSPACAFITAPQSGASTPRSRSAASAAEQKQ
jgi:hypothetical protein